MKQNTRSEMLRWLAGAGFNEEVTASGASLQIASSGKVLESDDFVVSATYRFENQSVPDDEAILFALATPRSAPPKGRRWGFWPAWHSQRWQFPASGCSGSAACSR